MAEMLDLIETKRFIEEVIRTVYVVIKTRCPSLRFHDGEDIAQDVLIKILRVAGNGTKIENLRSYIWRAAYTTALDVLEERKGEISLDEKIETTEMEAILEFFPLDSALERKDATRRIERMIEDLPDNRRRILRLHLSGMSTKEMAVQLGWTHSKVRHLFYRGVEDLRRQTKEVIG